MSIQTFIFFDIETTGLPGQEANRTKITELTFLAVSRFDLERSNCKSLPPISKLSLLFNPHRKIQPDAARITGLTNEFLVSQPIFSHKINCINDFLDLPKPVCLVAHNGNRFDYKILRTEYIDARSNLPDDLLCVDTLKAFKDIMREMPCTEIMNESTNINEDEWPDLDITPEEWQEIDNLIDSFSKLSSTPKCETKQCKAASRSYKLIDLYKSLLNKDPLQSHRAEADCLMLLECVVATKHKFLEWADKNCQPISQVKPYVRK